MIKIWHFKESEWEIQIIDIDPEFTIDQILEKLSISKEPSMILGDKESCVAIFESLVGADNYVSTVEFQDLKKVVIIHDFPSLLNFLDLMSGTIMGLKQTEEFFDDDDWNPHKTWIFGECTASLDKVLSVEEISAKHGKIISDLWENSFTPMAYQANQNRSKKARLR